MSEEISKKFEGASNSQSELSPTLASCESGDLGINLDLTSMDVDSTPRSSLPSALCSVDVARQSREMVDEYIEELGANPDQTVKLVQEDCSTPTGPKGFTSSLCAVKNGRKTMEDRHIIIHDLNRALNLQMNDKQYSYYAIFDGHAGVDAASFAAAHLHQYLVETEAFAQGRIEDAYREAFEMTDKMYIKRCREDGVDQLKPSGTTALCALIIKELDTSKKTVHMAWVGDSQAVLVRNGFNEEIMLPHKPDLESERIRIQELGGLVVFIDTWRVNGVLSVSRAIGDPDHKPFVIADPSYSHFEIEDSLDFLVLGCDGLFDQLTSQDISSHVFEFLCRNENRDPEEVIYEVSTYLSQMAIKEGSSDNITSIVLFFKPLEQLVATGLDFPSGNENDLTQEFTEPVPATNLATTNGGHFPYTDFLEMPLGANVNLHSVQQEEAHPVEEEVAASAEPAVQNSTSSENLLDANDKPTDSASDPPVADALTADSASWFALDDEQVVPPSTLQPLSPGLPEDSLALQPEESSDIAASELQDNTPNSAPAPFTMAEDMNDQHEIPEPLTEANPDKLVGFEEGSPIKLEASFADSPVAPTEPANAKNPFSDFDVETSDDNASVLSNLVNQTLTSPLEASQLSFEPPQEPTIQSEPLIPEADVNDTVPDILQHASDSGFCYTNSISEFSTSFPSENKLDDNFCSTPVHIEPLQDNNVSESGLIDSQSALSQLSINDSQELPKEELSQPTVANNQIENELNWEASLQNHSLIIDNFAQPNETSDNNTLDILAEPILSAVPEPSEQVDKVNNNIGLLIAESEAIFQEEPALANDDFFFQPQVQSDSNFSETVATASLVTSQPHSELNPFVSNTNVETSELLSFDNKQTIEVTQQESILPERDLVLNYLAEEASTQPLVQSDVQFENNNELNTLLNFNKSNNLLVPTLAPETVEAEKIPEPLDVTKYENEIPLVQGTSAPLVDPLPVVQCTVEEAGTDKIEIVEALASKPENKSEKPPAKLLSAKPKIPSATKKPLAAATTSAATKSKLSAAAPKVASTLPKPTATSSKVAPIKPAVATATRNVASSKIAPKPALTRPTSTIPKATTLKPRTATTASTQATTSTKVNGTGGSRILGSTKPSASTGTAAAAKSALSSRAPSTTTGGIPKVSSTRPLAPKANPIATRPSTSTSNLKPRATEPPKPLAVRKSLPSSIKSAATAAPKPSQPALARPNLAKTTTSSAPPTRARPSPVASSIPSKVSTLRPSPSAKPITKAPLKPANSKPVSTTSTGGIKVVKKPAASSVKITEAKTTETLAQSNGTVKSPYTTKRPIGVENSLKQELEDAVMNGLNGSAHPMANVEENTNGVPMNGHSDL